MELHKGWRPVCHVHCNQPLNMKWCPAEEKRKNNSNEKFKDGSFVICGHTLQAASFWRKALNGGASHREDNQCVENGKNQ